MNICQPNLTIYTGTAFMCAAGPKSASNHEPHVTLTHIDTAAPTVIQKVHHYIKKYIHHYFNTRNIDKTHGHFSLGHHIASRGPNSVFLAGEIEDFKRNLNDYLISKKDISVHISPYIPAHINVKGDLNAKIYKKFNIDCVTHFTHH